MHLKSYPSHLEHRHHYQSASLPAVHHHTLSAPSSFPSPHLGNCGFIRPNTSHLSIIRIVHASPLLAVVTLHNRWENAASPSTTLSSVRTLDFDGPHEWLSLEGLLDYDSAPLLFLKTLNLNDISGHIPTINKCLCKCHPSNDSAFQFEAITSGRGPKISQNLFGPPSGSVTFNQGSFDRVLFSIR